MQAPAFWWRRSGLAATLLRPIALAYGAVAGRRLARQGQRADAAVVCFGDFTLGGAGKTPAAIATGRLLRAAGERPAFLTRGYGGRLSGPLEVDVSSHDVGQVGDEALLLARELPTILARDRVAGAQAACAADASVIVMDDGFHNPSLTKDCSVLVIDAARGLGNGLVFPAGPLRAPLAAQLQHAHALLVIGAGDAADSTVAMASARGLTTFSGRLEADSDAVAHLRPRRVLAFAGIGAPEKFFASLAAAGIEVVVRRAFPDHHRFTQADARQILRESESNSLIPVTTEKDFVRLGDDEALADLRQRTKTLPVTLRFDEDKAFLAFLLGRLKKRA